MVKDLLAYGRGTRKMTIRMLNQDFLPQHPAQTSHRLNFAARGQTYRGVPLFIGKHIV